LTTAQVIPAIHYLPFAADNNCETPGIVADSVPFQRLSKMVSRNREVAHENRNRFAAFTLKKRRTLPINLLNVVTGPPA
jgi:hypothetical protein